MRKIRNLIFDFGQVLVHFEPDIMLAPYLPDPADRAVVVPVLFDRLYWDRLDIGAIEDDELLDAVCARLPERLHRATRLAYRNWFRNLPEIDGMRKLIRNVKRDYGVRCYLLSNISRGFAAHADEIPILRELDGCVFSSVCGYTKPHREVFACCCDRFGLAPSESVFIDDRPKNVAGAADFGFDAYLFDGDVARLEEYLTELLKG